MAFPLPATSEAILGSNLGFDPSWMEPADNMGWVSCPRIWTFTKKSPPYAPKEETISGWNTGLILVTSVFLTSLWHTAIPPALIPRLERHGSRNCPWMNWTCWILGYGAGHLGKHTDTSRLDSSAGLRTR